MKRIVISQPMFFPWVGLFEQIRLADMYVHYDDVQLPQGRSFINRVQIKGPKGTQWLTAPVRKGSHLINEAVLAEPQSWCHNHLETLRHFYAKAPFLDEMLALAQTVYKLPSHKLSDMNCFTIEAVAKYFGFQPYFHKSSELQGHGSSSERLLNLVRELGGTIYITGHGAKNYLDHDLFDRNGIRVEYMDYQKRPYPQLHGEFTPFVTILDLIANVGRAGIDYICSETKHWKEFINEPG